MSTVDGGWEAIPFEGFSDYEWNESLRLVRSWKGFLGLARRETPVVLRGYVAKGGYLKWLLTKDSGGKKDVFFNQLVCTKHHGPSPVGYETCHNDGDPTNNSPDNVRWGSRKENLADRTRHGKASCGMLAGEAHGQAKLTAKDVLAIRSEPASTTNAALAKAYGMSASGMWHVRNGHRWKCLNHKLVETGV